MVRPGLVRHAAFPFDLLLECLVGLPSVDFDRDPLVTPTFRQRSLMSWYLFAKTSFRSFISRDLVCAEMIHEGVNGSRDNYISPLSIARLSLRAYNFALGNLLKEGQTMSMHHHHHHTTNHLQHHHHFSHHMSSPSSMEKPTMANRGQWLAVSVLTSLLIIGAAIAFIVVTFTVFPQHNAFPSFLYVPFTIVASLMIVIAIVSLVREIRIYKKIPSQSEGEPKEEDVEDDRFDEE